MRLSLPTLEATRTFRELKVTKSRIVHVAAVTVFDEEERLVAIIKRLYRTVPITAASIA
ncbi:hypothetical protein [Halocatena salina]|uniref:Uncharacterized protein n=1 Tax=Halocatena salina TaxID=2934340 RepID=A0A8U0A8D2_9EURY|nr:hypothetical protein [Halocatena salina]UPM44748.1 hypothetical protein MW046_17110 [Halocatena salina]